MTLSTAWTVYLVIISEPIPNQKQPNGDLLLLIFQTTLKIYLQSLKNEYLDYGTRNSSVCNIWPSSIVGCEEPVNSLMRSRSGFTCNLASDGFLPCKNVIPFRRSVSRKKLVPNYSRQTLFGKDLVVFHGLKCEMTLERHEHTSTGHWALFIECFKEKIIMDYRF